MAAELGFEPRQTESESAVLPLHNSATLNRWNIMLHYFAHVCQIFFELILHQNCKFTIDARAKG